MQPLFCEALSVGIETAIAQNGQELEVQQEWGAVEPGRRTRRTASVIQLFRGRRQSDPPAAVPGAKAKVVQLFAAVPFLTVLGSVVELQAGGVRVEIKNGPETFGPLAAVLQPALSDRVKLLDSALRGEPVAIGPDRTLRLAAGRPFPVMIPQTDGYLTFRFPPGTVVTEGRYTAALRSVNVWPDRAEIDVEWKLLGLVDLAANPVVWWGD